MSRLPQLALLCTCLILPLAVVNHAAAQQDDTDLPVARVVMYNAGVSYLEHAGQVDGDAEINLEFNVSDINDLLKSMVVRDLGGGQIAAVAYESQEPIEHILQRFAVDLNGDPTMANLLRQVRGEEVEIFAPERLVGTIVGVEQRPRGEGETVVQVDYLNLLTEEGLRSVAMESVGRIRFTNERLAGEMQQALAALAQSHATDKKTVTLNFHGEGQRPVRVSYIQQSPVWKTSYRLVLDDEGQALLQGWAIVENTSETDWENVDLTLVSGRPISFVMDLYQPLYAPRPVVAPPMFAALMPQVYGRDLDGLQGRVGPRAPQPEASAGEGYGYARSAPAEGEILAYPEATWWSGGNGDGDNRLSDQMAQSLQAAAQGGEVGELFQYHIDAPVTLTRGRSAMLPIVQEEIDAEKIAIYNPAVHPSHPLDGLRLTNGTELHLMAGPITVFDGGAYAGDAQIDSLAPGDERLVSYAMDLDTEVSAKSASAPRELVSVRIERGVVEVRHHLERTTTYTVKNSAGEDLSLLIEQPIATDWQLVAPAEPAETTRDRYRFAVAAAAGQSTELAVTQEQIVSNQVVITNLDDNTIALFLSSDVVSEAVKEAIREVVIRKTDLAELNRQQQELARQISVIEREQNRIRQNMESLERDTDLYRRYVGKFSEQEDEMEELRGQETETIAHRDQLQRELEEYLTNLDLS